ncbi:MAG: type III-A CRISPR-associated RAMP protein Csm5 [Candidatus Anammoxibacter sp.]
MKKYKLKCELLSPLHIGTGDEIDPLNYIIKEDQFHKISLERFVADMSDIDRDKFEKLVEKGNLIKLRRYVSENIDLETGSIYSTAVSSNVITIYKSKIGNIQNQLLVSPFIRTQGGTTPFVPGSSIKGSIRTAVINDLSNKSSLPKPKYPREEYEFESKVLGCKDAKNDPFRGIKIADAHLENDSTIIREVKNVSRRNDGNLQSNNIQIICEVTNSFITGTIVNFETEIAFDDALFSTNYLSKKITLEQIIKSCNSFYKDKLEEEHQKHYKDTEADQFSTMIINNAKTDTNSFILRLGRFSGVESVTIDNYRNPRPPGNKTSWGGTRNIAEMKYPMGWVRVTSFMI